VSRALDLLVGVELDLKIPCAISMLGGGRFATMAVLKIQESPPSLGMTNSTGAPAAAACSVRAPK
jgi:hypothetical protein